MMNAPDFQSCHEVSKPKESIRWCQFQPLDRALHTPIWWRNARISNWSAARLQNEAASRAIGP